MPSPPTNQVSVLASLAAGWWRIKTVAGKVAAGTIELNIVDDDSHLARLVFTYRINWFATEAVIHQVEYQQQLLPIKFSRARLLYNSGSDETYLELFFSDYDAAAFAPIFIYGTVDDGEIYDPVATSGSYLVVATLRFGPGIIVESLEAASLGRRCMPDPQAAATASMTLEITGSGLNYALSYAHAIRVYAYTIFEGKKFYSQKSVTSTPNYTTIGNADALRWAWTAFPDASGYVVFRYDTEHSYNFDYAKDVGNVVTFDDNNTGWSNSVSATTITPNVYLKGLAVIGGKVNVGTVVNASYLMEVGGSLNAWQFYLDGRRLTNTASFVTYQKISLLTIANTVAESSLTGSTESGAAEIPAGLEVGSAMRINGCGVLSTSATAPTLQLRLLLGTGPTVLATTDARLMPASLSNALFEYELVLKVLVAGASGSVSCIGKLVITPDDESTPFVFTWKSNAAVTVDLTASPNALVPKVTWGTASASNTLTQHELSMVVLPKVI